MGRTLDAGGAPALDLMEKALKIRARSGKKVGLIANRAQREYAGRAGRNNIVLKARQMGITTWIAGRFFLRTIANPGTVTVQVAHTQEAAEAIFRIVHRFLDRLPEELREGALKSAKSSARRIAFPELDSEYLVETAGDRNAGRGLTIANLHCTELARWPGDPEETLAGLRATLSPQAELAMESTPNGASGCFWREWRDAEKTGAVRHFFPWWLEEGYTAEAVEEDSLSEDEGRLMDSAGLNLGQIGYRRRIRENFRGLAAQEYAEDADSCFLAGGSCYFDVETLDRRLREAAAPPRKRGDLWIWAPPQPGRQYLVAVDPAGGSQEGDFTVAQVVDLEQGLQCAELQTRRTSLESAVAAADLAREYNHALIAVERNGLGMGVLAHLASFCHYDRVWRDGQQEGWLTTHQNRLTMLANLDAALVASPGLFSSERLLRECRTFVRGAGGHPAAAAGEHDDCVMAMALALAVREECRGTKRLQ
jgi:hypothetical protein